MIKKVPVTKLARGMFVHDLNCGWLDHPFLSARFLLDSDDKINRIRALGVREVYIDIARGRDVDDEPLARKAIPEPRRVEPHIVVEPAAPVQLPRPATRSMEEEMRAARRVHAEAREVAREILTDVRLGRQIDMAKAEPVVEKVVDSIFRNKDALLALARIKEKDEYTFQHSVSICTMLVAFCRELELDRGVTRMVGLGGLLHDIGKMKVPAEILGKAGALTEAEMALIRDHPETGYRLITGLRGIDEVVAQVVLEHHERADGSGYPRGLRNDEISRYGHMAAIVDVYDALTSDRCYRTRIEPTAALRELYKGGDQAVGGELVQRFIRCVGIYPPGSAVRLASGQIAVVREPTGGDLLRPVVVVVYDERKGRFVNPRALDLADGQANAAGDHIVGHVVPGKFGIDPRGYL